MENQQPKKENLNWLDKLFLSKTVRAISVISFVLTVNEALGLIKIGGTTPLDQCKQFFSKFGKK